MTKTMTNKTKITNTEKNEPASTSSPLSIGEGSGVRLSGVRLFDKIIDRTGSDDLKHGVLQERYGDANLLPLWVADMEFETPQLINDALSRRLDHSLFGYTKQPKGYWQKVTRWNNEHHE